MGEVINSKDEVAYVFKECNRKIQEARDNEQIEGEMTLYGKEDESNTGKTGNSTAEGF